MFKRGRNRLCISLDMVTSLARGLLSFYCDFPKSDIIYTYENRPHSLASRDEPCLERANALQGKVERVVLYGANDVVVGFIKGV